MDHQAHGFKPSQGKPMFPWERNFTLIAQYLLVSGTDSLSAFYRIELKLIQYNKTEINWFSLSRQIFIPMTPWKICPKKVKFEILFFHKYIYLAYALYNVFQAMSLPLVVTTGANQGCLSQASVMWQCYSTDVVCMVVLYKNPKVIWCFSLVEEDLGCPFGHYFRQKRAPEKNHWCSVS